MNGELCLNCEYRANKAGVGPEFQDCNYPDKSGIPTKESRYIWFMHEDECPKQEQYP